MVQVGSQSMADRYTYVPLVGVFIAAVWLVGDLAARRAALRKAAGLAAVVVLAGAINALKLTGKKPGDMKVVVAGAGAAGIPSSIANSLVRLAT